MSTPSEGNFSKQGDIRQQDLLDVVEYLEKKRCRLLIRVVEDFISLGKLLTQAREMVIEFKRRKFTGEFDCPGDCEKNEMGQDLSALFDELLGRFDLLRGLIGQGLCVFAKAGETVSGMVVFVRSLRRKFQEDFTNWVDTRLRTKDGNAIYYSTREGFAEEVSFRYLVGIERPREIDC